MFEKPTPTAKIWRYLSFTKFVAMLHYGTLRFRLASALEDKHEGTLPWPSLDESDLDIVRTYDDIQAVTAVNCWQVSEEESAAMWRVYTGQGEGLAIQSIYDRLIQAFDGSDRALKGEPVYVGVVKYIEEDGLMDLGYALCRHPRGTAWLKAHHYHLSFVKAKAATSDIPLEIHWHIERPSRPFTIDLEGLWERAVPARIAGVDSWMLSPEDLVLRLGLHACKHRLTDSLRPLCDIAATIRRYGHILDWNSSRRARATGASRPTCISRFVSPGTWWERPCRIRSYGPSSPEGFDPQLVNWATVALLENQVGAALFPELLRLWKGPRVRDRLAIVAKILSPAALAKSYRIAPTSRRRYGYYPTRLKELVRRHGPTLWRLFCRDQQLVALAEAKWQTPNGCNRSIESMTSLFNG